MGVWIAEGIGQEHREIQRAASRLQQAEDKRQTAEG